MSNIRDSQILLSGSYTNQFSGGAKGEELLVLDGERADYRLSWYRRLGRCATIGFELPGITHTGGYFDNAIERWHGYFGLPNANRNEIDDNQLAVYYSGGSASSLSLEDNTTALGDVHLQYARPASCMGWSSINGFAHQRMGVKLPTGDIEKLTGSGTTDVYWDLTTLGLINSGRIGLRTALGFIVLGESDVLTNSKRAALYGSSVFGWRYTRTIELLVQADWHTPLYDSTLKELGAISTQITFGGRWRARGGHLVDLALQEDLATDTGPDVGLVFSYRQQF